jgi:hypothetical protein
LTAARNIAKKRQSDTRLLACRFAPRGEGLARVEFAYHIRSVVYNVLSRSLMPSKPIAGRPPCRSCGGHATQRPSRNCGGRSENRGTVPARAGSDVTVPRPTFPEASNVVANKKGTAKFPLDVQVVNLVMPSTRRPEACSLRLALRPGPSCPSRGASWCRHPADGRQQLYR